MPIEWATTERGFRIGEFTERYGKRASIQESSLGTESCIWLGADDGRAHLTQDMADDLIGPLLHFVLTGQLPREGELEGESEPKTLRAQLLEVFQAQFPFTSFDAAPPRGEFLLLDALEDFVRDRGLASD